MADEKGYSVPMGADYDKMSAGDADIALNKLNADMRDLDGHPMWHNDNPQHKDFVDYQNNLLDVKRRYSDTRPEDEKILEAAYTKGLERQKAAQVNLRREAKAEIEALAKLGYQDAQLPAGEIAPFQIEMWRMQRLNGEGDFKELAPLMEKIVSPEDRQSVSSLLDNPRLSKESKQDIIEALLRDAYAAMKSDYEATKLPSLPEEDNTYKPGKFGRR
jgi:hypothetical protein